MATKKYLDENGAVLLNQLLAAKFNTKADKTEIPTKTSDLTNDSNFAVDANYVHTDNNYTTTEKNKLNGIESGAQVNKIETIKVNNVAQTITSKAVDITVPTNTNQLTNGAGFITKNVNDLTNYTTTTDMENLLAGKLDTTLKGAASGLAELDSSGKVPASQLPSFVDDIIEGYYYNGKFYKEAAHTTEITGETGKIYVDLPNNSTYRWSGTIYVQISSSLTLGETSSTAYRGDRGKTAYDHATDANRLTTAQASGFYKFATSAEGHIKSVTAVGKSDLTGLGVEDASNKVTSISGSSTNTQYPSAKLVYDQLALKQDVIDSTHKLSADNIDDTNTTHKFTTAEDITKLSGIEADAQVNVIETVKVDGTALTVTNKAVNITGKENTSNKVTSLSASSTNTQYPSAKLVYDQLATKQGTLTAGSNINITNNVISEIDATGVVYLGTLTNDIALTNYIGKYVKLTMSSAGKIPTGYTACISQQQNNDLFYVYDANTLCGTALYHDPANSGNSIYLAKLTRASNAWTCTMTAVVSKVTSLNASATHEEVPSAKIVYDQLALKEVKSNKVTSISASSTDTQYPSAKLVYDQLALKLNTADLVALTNQEINTIFDFEVANA